MKQTVQPQTRRGPVPTGKGTPIQVRLDATELTVLDLHIVAAPDPTLGRPEATRMALVEGLKTKGLLAPSSRAPPAAIAERATSARSHATLADDEAMTGIDAMKHEKADGRACLTDKPAMAAKARAELTEMPK